MYNDKVKCARSMPWRSPKLSCTPSRQLTTDSSPASKRALFRCRRRGLFGGLGFRFQGVGFRAPTSELAESLKADVEKWQAQALSHEVRRCVTLLAIAIARQASSNFRTEDSSLKLLAFYFVSRRY